MRERNLHILNDRLREFAISGVIKDEDTKILEHISTCDFCLMRYTAIVEEDLLSLPVEFGENVIEKAKETRQPLFKEKQKLFYGYCFRVGLACACSLILLFSIDTTKFVDIGEKMNQVNLVSSMFSGKVQSMKDYIINMEGNLNEVEKK
jgi:hypothetical protein